MVFKEDIQDILDKLLEALQATEDYGGITELKYDADGRRVIIKAPEGYLTVSLTTTSGSRVLMDVITELWAYY